MNLQNSDYRGHRLMSNPASWIPSEKILWREKGRGGGLLKKPPPVTLTRRVCSKDRIIVVIRSRIGIGNPSLPSFVSLIPPKQKTKSNNMRVLSASLLVVLTSAVMDMTNAFVPTTSTITTGTTSVLNAARPKIAGMYTSLGGRTPFHWCRFFSCL